MNTALNLFWIKLIHTVIWTFFVAVIFYVLYSGVSNRITIYTWIAVGLVVAEGLVLLLFRGYCPLTLIARKYADSDRDNFDIFLPNWLARYNKVIFSALYVIGLIVIAYRLLHHV